ncbi:hypothetical protein GCM10022240_12240 [Microbacterium kribbense]|uniref:Integral membrane protein n=1 Tax=Microbacterium kribbense TaxID=433645 RepID=A0ABP7GCQ9_9MICO
MSAPQPNGRPRPQYGEYASAEEQRARIREPASPAPPVGPAPAAPPPASGMRPARAAASRHPVDRIVTIALLAYGGVNVLLSVMSFVNLAEVVGTTYTMMGVPGHFTDTAAAHAWGIAAAVVMVVGYLGTLLLSVRAIRHGRRSWWIPVVGAVVSYIGVVICVAVPLMNDPAFVGYLQAH